MQALLIYKNDHGGRILNAIDGAHSPEDFVAEMAMQARSLRTPLLVETLVAPVVPAVWFFDRNMLVMALLNAIHHSIAFARERVRSSVRVDEGMLCMAVHDDSDGYPPHILETVVTDTPLNSSGTGLGLRFASLIAKAHGNNGRRGRLVLRNDGDSVFEMWVP